MKNTKNAPREVETVPGSVRETERSSVKPIIRSAYSNKPHSFAPRSGPTQTKQSFVEECDVNFIVAKYQRTGALAHADQHEPNYGFATSIDFRESVNLVMEAQSMFAALPSSLRKKFGNDPSNYLEFVQNPENLQEMIDLGLAINAAPEPTDPVEVKIINPPKEGGTPKNLKHPVFTALQGSST